MLDLARAGARASFIFCRLGYRIGSRLALTVHKPILETLRFASIPGSALLLAHPESRSFKYTPQKGVYADDLEVEVERLHAEQVAAASREVRVGTGEPGHGAKLLFASVEASTSMELDRKAACQ